MKLTVVISYYKALDNLKLILKALNNQSSRDFEVIVSEDDNNQETTSYLQNNKKLYCFPIIHLHQEEDKGFRKNMMLNRSIVRSNSGFLAFIDGDCVPHKHFAKEYIKNIEDGYFLSGRSVMLGEKISSEVKKDLSLSRLNLLSLMFSDSWKIKEGVYFPFCRFLYKKRGLLGRNWGIKKEYLLKVNGFDEDYVNAGVGEDVDIEWRLISIGLKLKLVKNRAIVYHLYHSKTYLEDRVRDNYTLLHKKKSLENIICLNGISNTVGE